MFFPQKLLSWRIEINEAFSINFLQKINNLLIVSYLYYFTKNKKNHFTLYA
jgi:hypothetical protein